MGTFTDKQHEKRTRIFFDTEFTGLHKNTTLISIGLVADNGKTFYAEFNDYDKSQVNEWLETNVMAHLEFPGHDEIMPRAIVGLTKDFHMKGSTAQVKEALTSWLSQFKQVVMWSDCLSYDWVLFNNIFGTAFDLPENVYYIPFDICTFFEIMKVNPDINREEFASYDGSTQKHNALHDALVIRECYRILRHMAYPKSVR